MPLADEWRISCQSLLVSGDGFEPRLQNNSLWLTSSAICTLNLDNIWLNKSKVIISQVDKLFKISPAVQLLQTALTKKKKLKNTHIRAAEISASWLGKYLQRKTKLCWSMNEQLWSSICHLTAHSPFPAALKPQGHGPLGSNIAHVQSQHSRFFLFCVKVW